MSDMPRLTTVPRDLYYHETANLRGEIAMFDRSLGTKRILVQFRREREYVQVYLIFPQARMLAAYLLQACEENRN